MLSGSGTYCVKSCVLDTQSPLKARHVAPVYDLSVSVIRWEQENLWKPGVSKGQNRDPISNMCPMAYT